MHTMTESNLKAAFAGESQAHMKYLIFSQVAEKEGRPNIARLFKAIAYAEQVHATNHLKVLGGIGKTSGNLEEAISGETFEVDEMYPAYKAEAELQQEKDAVRSTHYALEAEKIHASMYALARSQAAAGSDITVGNIYICPTCGYTVEGTTPDACPVCGVKKELFKIY